MVCLSRPYDFKFLKDCLPKLLNTLFHLTHFMSMLSFYLPWKHEDPSGFLVFRWYRKIPVVWNGLTGSINYKILITLKKRTTGGTLRKSFFHPVTPVILSSYPLELYYLIFNFSKKFKLSPFPPYDGITLLI